MRRKEQDAGPRLVSRMTARQNNLSPVQNDTGYDLGISGASRSRCWFFSSVSLPSQETASGALIWYIECEQCVSHDGSQEGEQMRATQIATCGNGTYLCG